MEFRRSPREGCAVFVEAIARARGTPVRRSVEELFTTIHELGHVFNLQHTTQRSYMVQGGGLSGANEFTAGQQAMLRCCSTSANVWPGGKPFSDSGPFSHMNNLGNLTTTKALGLSLHIGMEQKEFWAFEPVELDIELKLSKAHPRVLVPNTIDPGYDNFQIWIEEPNGERRLYRSPRRYCKGDARLSLQSGGSFLRDVSIFGQSGGYTFRCSGPHRLWAVFEIKRGVRIQSNTLEVNVRGHSESQLYAQAKAALQHAVRGKFLYHRVAQATPTGQLRRLKTFVEENRGLASVGSVQYALGKALAQQQLANGRAVSKPVTELLSRAIDAKHLGRRQRSASAALLERIAAGSDRPT